MTLRAGGFATSPVGSIKTINLTPSKEEKCRNCDQVQKILKSILSETKDSRYLSYKPELECAGSYYDNLKVSEADEFDYAIIFKIPEQHFKISGTGSGLQMSVFCQMKLADPTKKGEYELFINKEDNYLQPDKFFNWFYGHLARTLNTLQIKNPNDFKDVTMKKKTPCVTLRIPIADKKFADVDVAPSVAGYGLPFQASLPPNTCSWKKYAEVEEELETHPTRTVWSMTTKPCKEEGCLNPERFWRISVSPLEKRFWHGIDSENTCRKDVLRLLKKLRLNENWMNLQSYALKNFVMCNALKFEQVFWNKNNVGICFLEMLRRLKSALEEKKIVGFFYRDRNLLLSMKTEDEANNIANRIGKILADLEKEGAHIKKYIN